MIDSGPPDSVCTLACWEVTIASVKAGKKFKVQLAGVLDCCDITSSSSFHGMWTYHSYKNQATATSTSMKPARIFIYCNCRWPARTSRKRFWMRRHSCRSFKPYSCSQGL